MLYKHTRWLISKFLFSENMESMKLLQTLIVQVCNELLVLYDDDIVEGEGGSEKMGPVRELLVKSSSLTTQVIR